jgi:hypothetical protein
MSGADLDTRVRTQAFQFLTEQTRFHGEVVPRDLLERGFDFEGRRVPLIGPQGIFKPAVIGVSGGKREAGKSPVPELVAFVSFRARPPSFGRH